MANLFGKNKLRSAAESVETDRIIHFIGIIKRWHCDYHQGTLKRDKETSREQEYNQNFFKDILGYKEKPAVPFNFEPKATTEKGQLPDAVIGYTDKANGIKNISAVVELKGAAIDLDRPQQREGNMSPVQQAFKYKTQYRNCPFVIVSNFWEFRLYRDNLLDYEAWTLDDLVNPDNDYLLFKTWYVLLKSDNFITDKGTSKTENILSDIRIEQENISKKFYKVYKDARLVLLRDIYSRNEAVRDNIDMGVEKAQKIIDRIVFTCFAEDRGLLPDNTLQRVIRDAEQSSFGVSLWQAFKGLFEAIDSGSDKLEIPDGYNGGLFKHDEVLNNLRISDDGLMPVVELSKYDFTEDLSVSILGHIFEQSISDLEEIKNKVNVDKNIEAIITQSRRKKDGIFYTPDYIVRYIVDNSLGKYLNEHEQKFKDEYGLKDNIQDKTYAKRERQAYQKYQDFLQNIKVVDPACGSGAFLVYVFDYLMAENQRVGDILGNTIFSSDEYIRDILKNNIYGVDLNEESVEITKLSLWLKSAQKGKKLTSLDNNIKCGNSLIDNPEVAGNKAFNWQDQFSDVFKNGGFDVVVGNPPYVKEYTAKSAFDGLHHHAIYQGKMDLWYFFGALALDITKKDKGLIGFIAPSNWVTNSGAQKFRDKVLSAGQLIEFIDFGDFKVFDQAGIQTMIYIIKHSNASKYSFKYSKVINSRINHEDAKSFLAKVENDKFVYYLAEINKTLCEGKTFNFNDQTTGFVLEKIRSVSQTTLFNQEVAQGIVAPQDYVNKKAELILGGIAKVGDGIFNLSNKEYESLRLTDSEAKLVKPFYTTTQLGRYYGSSHNNSWVIYTDSKFNMPEEMDAYPNLKKHLDKFLPVITSDNKPYGLHRARDEKFFTGEKIISLRKTRKPLFTFTDFDTYVSQTYFVIKTERFNMSYLTAILNSKLVAFWLRYKGKMQGDMYQIDKAPLLEIPLVISENQDQLASLTDEIIVYLNDCHILQERFGKLIFSEFGVEKLPSYWWKLEFNDFIDKLGLRLSLQQKDELLQLFDKYRVECYEYDEQVQRIENEINCLVYKIYGLLDEDVKIIEQK